MADFLDEKRKEIADRLRQLKPQVDEYARLSAAADALGISSVPAAAGPHGRKKGPGRPSGKPGRKPSATSVAGRKASGRQPGRRKGSGTRAAEALKFVTERPGITIPELAAKMEIKQNYLYRVLPGLEQESKVKKEGRGWHPANGARRAT
jgi:hypothetical protein